MAIAKECKQVHGWAKVHFEIGSEAGDEDYAKGLWFVGRLSLIFMRNL